MGWGIWICISPPYLIPHYPCSNLYITPSHLSSHCLVNNIHTSLLHITPSHTSSCYLANLTVTHSTYHSLTFFTLSTPFHCTTPISPHPIQFNILKSTYNFFSSKHYVLSKIELCMLKVRSKIFYRIVASNFEYF